MKNNDAIKTQNLEVILSISGDGPQPNLFSAELGSCSVGPVGLLGVLEASLGIPSSDVPFTRRLIQYLACIESSIEGDAFYYASYQADPFSVASTLLRWRDHWYLGGWKGKFSEQVSGRLKDMARIEVHAAESVDPGLGQRVQRVQALLMNTRTTIGKITLLDRLTDFAPAWQTLIKATGAVIKEQTISEPRAAFGTDLHAVQSHLLSGGSKKISLKGDGSLVALTADVATDSVMATVIAASNWSAQGSTTAILAESRGSLLDEALESIAAPRLGYSSVSPIRPLFQILPLACELLWQPLDPKRLLQFLSHPYGPLPARVRRRLAQCVVNYPGIGGIEWQSTVSALIAEEEVPRQEKLSEEIGYWLEPTRFAPQTGIDTATLIDRAQRLQSWMSGRYEHLEEVAERNYYSVARSQVQDFLQAVERLEIAGRNTLTRDNVLRLIDDVRGSGISLSDRCSEVMPGLLPIVRAEHAGVFHKEVDRVIWWDCQANDHVSRWPWSLSEQEALRSEGVALQSESDRLAWLGRAWTKPILCAKEQSILILHSDVDRHHPIWDQLTAQLNGLPEYALQSAEAQALLMLSSSVRAPALLPRAKRWWVLNQEVGIPKRNSESYSSLDKYVHSPYEWLLRYAARIHPGTLSAMSEGNLLLGNLAHRCFEQFFEQHEDIGTLKPKSVEKWVNQSLPQLLSMEGASLLMLGQHAECQQFISRTREALAALISHLQQAHVVSVQTELAQAAHFCGGELSGYIDLLATTESGDEIIIDVKWGGRNYRIASIRNDSYLQLATYAKLRRDNQSQSSAYLSYFIVDDAAMLNCNHDQFPQGRNIQPASGENWAELWQRFEHTWRWRHTQMAEGQIEVTSSKTEADALSTSPEDALAIPAASDTYSDYKVLIGWGENA